jgi:hypothetical protein
VEFRGCCFSASSRTADHVVDDGIAFAARHGSRRAAVH